MNKIIKYENDLIKEQDRIEDAEYLFNDFLKSQFADCATHNFLINKVRTEDLAKSKIAIFVYVCLTFIFCILYIINQL